MDGNQLTALPNDLGQLNSLGLLGGDGDLTTFRREEISRWKYIERTTKSQFSRYMLP